MKIPEECIAAKYWNQCTHKLTKHFLSQDLSAEIGDDLNMVTIEK